MRLALLVVALAGCGRIGFDARGVAVDSTGTGAINANAVTSLALTTLEVGDGTDECLIAALVLSNPAASAVALRWNGALMTQVYRDETGTTETVLVERLIAPEPGAQALTAEWTGVSDAVLGAVSLSGTDQQECVRVAAVADGTSDIASVSIPSAPGHLTIDVSATASTFGAATQTPRWTAIADGAPTLRQQTSHVGGGTFDTCVLPSTAVTGDTLVFVGAAVGSPLQSVAGAGAAWQLAVSSAFNSNIEVWYGVVTADSTRTINYSGTVVSSMRCWVGELTGLVASGALDVTSSASGSVGPAAPGPMATSNAHDLLIVGYSSFGQLTWGVPTQGPWTTLGEVVAAADAHVVFAQPVASPGTWDPSIAVPSPDPRWDAAAAAFEISSQGISGALSTAAGTTRNAHAWSLGAASGWTAVGLDAFP